MNEEKEHNIFYKIMPDKKYRVFVNSFNGKKFYKIQVTQKEFDGQTKKYYKQVTFKKDIELENETDIEIQEAYENLYENKNDKYNPISVLNITKFRMLPKEDKQKVFDEYYSNISDEEVTIDDGFLD